MSCLQSSSLPIESKPLDILPLPEVAKGEYISPIIVHNVVRMYFRGGDERLLIPRCIKTSCFYSFGGWSEEELPRGQSECGLLSWSDPASMESGQSWIVRKHQSSRHWRSALPDAQCHQGQVVRHEGLGLVDIFKSGLKWGHMWDFCIESIMQNVFFSEISILANNWLLKMA